MNQKANEAPGHRSEYIASALALVFSAVSLWVAMGTMNANRQMVAAASWPFVQLDSSNTDNDGHLRIQLSLVNSGVGPAKLESFELFWKGKAYESANPLMRDCCGFRGFEVPQPEGEAPRTPLNVGTSTGAVVRAGETHPFLSYALGPDNEKEWRALDRARFQMEFRACYCSVFDDCWSSDLANLHPRRVEHCPKPALSYN